MIRTRDSERVGKRWEWVLRCRYCQKYCCKNRFLLLFRSRVVSLATVRVGRMRRRSAGAAKRIQLAAERLCMLSILR